MGYPYPYKTLLILMLLCQLAALQLRAQTSPIQKKDTLSTRKTDTLPSLKTYSKTIKDSARSLADSLAAGGKQLWHLQKNKAKGSVSATGRQLSDLPNRFRIKKPDSLRFQFENPFAGLLKPRSLVRFNGGYTSYHFNYRSAVDTPYVEKDLAQHLVSGNLGFTVADVLPLHVTFWSRQSNSHIFRDITDVQVSFNGAEFRNQLAARLRERLLKMAPSLHDSLTEKLYALKKLKLSDAKGLLLQNFSGQKLVEANEILKVPGITHDPNLPDSVNLRREDSLRKVAAAFLELYAKTKQAVDGLTQDVDSLKKQYQQSLQRIQRFRQLANGGWKEMLSPGKWKQAMQEYGIGENSIPAGWRWLLGIRNFSLGRSNLNYSDLTAKNISINGVNFEYNSWYYLAVAAGTVDYRFRDFSVNGSNKRHQFMYLVRAGIGRLEKNYFILSAWRGQKQLYAASTASDITVSGLSAEAKWQLNSSTYLIGEVAQSIAPDYRQVPVTTNTKFSLSDKSNQAYAVRLYSWWPATQTRVEGSYKKTGANFQSFSSFQTNAALESWSVKAEQSVWKRRLRIAASVRKNEFSNPYLVQQYESNTVFKSLSATFRMRKWPVITAAYQPMSQLTVLDDQVVENRFQTLTASVYHMYPIKKLNTATTLVLNKFYNNSNDTGYIYYNATNLYWLQNFFFNRFTANVAFSYSKNANYQLNVMEEGVQVNLGTRGSAGLGVKINSLNQEVVKTGTYINGSIRLWKQDMIYLSFERGYLPGWNTGLVRNDMANIQFVKNF